MSRNIKQVKLFLVNSVKWQKLLKSGILMFKMHIIDQYLSVLYLIYDKVFVRKLTYKFIKFIKFMLVKLRNQAVVLCHKLVKKNSLRNE